MNAPAHEVTPTAQLVGRNDPILQDLWAIKAEINAQANYSVAEIVRRLKLKQDEIKAGKANSESH